MYFSLNHTHAVVALEIVDLLEKDAAIGGSNLACQNYIVEHNTIHAEI
jgi:hypothetical protein